MDIQNESKLKNYWFQELQGKIHMNLLDSVLSNDWELVHPDVIDYFKRNCLGYIWTNHLAVIVLARSSYSRNDVTTIKRSIVIINNRFLLLFKEFNIKNLTDWNPDIHLNDYLTNKVLKDHTDNQRFELLKVYNSSIKIVNNWLRKKFDPVTLNKYVPFTLPPCTIAHSISNQKKVQQNAQLTRKKETDAIIPHYPTIRGEAHFRWNKLHRIYTKFKELLEIITPSTSLPLEFNYDEEHSGERLYFKLWDKSSFTIANKDKYSKNTVETARNRRRYHADEHKQFFLELIKVENIATGKESHEKIWFEDLIKESVLNQLPTTGSEEEKRRKKEFLNKWGYGNLESETFSSPFNTSVKGLLAQGDFIHHAQNRTDGLLLNIETFYAAATFGLATVDLITTTGMRMNELLQVSYTKECIVILEETLGNKVEKRYLLRLIPKGRDQPEDYFIGKETLKNLMRVFEFLKIHYNAHSIPKIKFNGNRRHLFPEEKPFFFQYNQRHLTEEAINACMRFLLHGMIFKTTENENVVLKAHLLRHAFATHAVQVEKIPIDIVGIWMHQKNLEVTDYYSAPTPSQIAQQAESWLKHTATHINITEAVKRSPEELQKMYEDAKNKVGTLNKVVGGVCTSHSFCPSKFQCVGCAAKVPEVEKKNELLKMKEWASTSEQGWREMGLLPEANRMNQVIRDCDRELHEIELMEGYLKDEKYRPKFRIK